VAARLSGSRSVVHVLDNFVTRASGGFQAFAIDNRDIAAAVAVWLLGLVSSYTMGGLIHVLLVIAIVVILLEVIGGRKA
jgi:hypothetical protein